MKKHQTGEVMLAVMIVMLAVVWLGRGHMGHGDNHAEHPAHQDRQMTKESSEHRGNKHD
ncbi:MAG: hypothetical protein ABL911_12085 [Gallionella sp.]|nr:hypothetical protein [Gallionella sp.]